MLKISCREVLAWLLLTSAIVFFGVTVTFAQDSRWKKEDGKIHMMIEKEENGTKVKVDTTFDLKDRDKLDEYLRSLDEGFDMPSIQPVPPEDLDQELSMSFHPIPPGEIDMEDFRMDMDRLKSEMRGLEKELKEMRMEVFSDSIHLQVKPGEGNEEEFLPFGRDEDFKITKNHSCCKLIRPDSLSGEARVIILSDGDEEENEGARVIEKRIDGEHGNRAIVIRRSDKKSDASDKQTGSKGEKSKTSVDQGEPGRIECYPNPGDGRFTLSFGMEKKGDTSIRIIDPSGKEVYLETMKDFSGDYSKQVDISGKGKGAFMLKISQNGKSVTKKIVVE